MIGVIVPAHNEEALITPCLRAIAHAARHPALAGEEVLTVVATDRCTDRTAELAAAEGAVVVETQAGSVGGARAAACQYALAAGARWIASTDADSTVPEQWLAMQVNCGADVYCGVVKVQDWSGFPEGMEAAFLTGEDVKDGHPHIHGANLGFSAAIYRAAGGFVPLAVSEDVALVRAFEALGARIARPAEPRVCTSPRRDPRAKGGFGDFLKNLEKRLLSQPGAST